jgi:hypothetical protein
MNKLIATLIMGAFLAFGSAPVHYSNITMNFQNKGSDDFNDIQTLNTQLTQAHPSLIKISLGGVDSLYLRDKAMTEFKNIIIQNSSQFYSMDLSDNTIKYGYLMDPFFDPSIHYKNLKEIKLNSIKVASPQHDSQTKPTNNTLDLFFVRNTQLTKIEMGHITDLMKDNIHGGFVISLPHSERVKIIKAWENLPHLIELFIPKFIFTDEVGKTFAEFLIHTKASLENLNLSDSKIKSANIQAEIMTQLGRFKNLTNLNLNGNQLSAMGINALGKSLHYLNSIRSLNLENNNLNGDFLNDLSAALPHYSNIFDINLSKNDFSKINENTKENLIKSLVKLETINFVNLNAINDKKFIFSLVENMPLKDNKKTHKVGIYCMQNDFENEELKKLMALAKTKQVWVFN